MRTTALDQQWAQGMQCGDEFQKKATSKSGMCSSEVNHNIPIATVSDYQKDKEVPGRDFEGRLCSNTNTSKT